jgi:hypothetical protein
MRKFHSIAVEKSSFSSVAVRVGPRLPGPLSRARLTDTNLTGFGPNARQLQYLRLSAALSARFCVRRRFVSEAHLRLKQLQLLDLRPICGSDEISG